MTNEAAKSNKKQKALSQALKANMAKRKAQARALNPKKTEQDPPKQEA